MWSDLFRGPAWIIILVLVLLLFGAPRLPALARSIGQSMKIFRSEVKTRDDDPDAEAIANHEADRGTADKGSADKGTPGDAAAKPTKPKK